MTCVIFTYILIAPEGFKINEQTSYILMICVLAAATATFFRWKHKNKTLKQ